MTVPGANSDAFEDRVTADLLKALNNPLRREALRLLHAAPDPLSAKRMTATVKDTGNRLSHHLKVLMDFGAVMLVGVEKVRGAKEKLYASRVADHARVLTILADTAEEDSCVRRG